MPLFKQEKLPQLSKTEQRPKKQAGTLLFQVTLWVVKWGLTRHLKSAPRWPAIDPPLCLKSGKHPINYLLSSHTEDLSLNSVWGRRRCQHHDRCTGGSRCPQHASLRGGSCTKTELTVCVCAQLTLCYVINILAD